LTRKSVNTETKPKKIIHCNINREKQKRGKKKKERMGLPFLASQETACVRELEGGYRQTERKKNDNKNPKAEGLHEIDKKLRIINL